MPSPARRAAAIAALAIALSLCSGVLAQTQIGYSSTCPSPGWSAVLETFGLSKTATPASADLLIACGVETPDRESVLRWLNPGRILVLEGESPLAEALGFVSSGKPAVAVRNVRDRRAEELLIVWEKAEPLVPTIVPAGARVLMEERWNGTPLAALLPLGDGNVLWFATPPGDDGYERYPLLAGALEEAGFLAPFRARNLWAFFDSAYRQRVDLDYLTARWERFGIAAIHVSAWQHWERDQAKDAWLNRLIEACHRRGILVYAWLEFPHVSERFWAEHPECREQTAMDQDAHLDWRKLINLRDPRCSARVKARTGELLRSFPWDGVNLAELYFESLEGPANAARFTPMNATVREEFRAESGIDPAEIFRAGTALGPRETAQTLQKFLNYRRRIIGDLQQEWLGFLAGASSPNGPLHLVVTQIDDRFDTSVRDSLGADSGEILRQMQTHPFAFLIEDPATIWHLGPSRYKRIAEAYAEQTPDPARLAIDINIFPRYQEVYPTKRQTGVELYRLVNAASRAFPRVALYFEHILADEDLPFLAAAAAPQARATRIGPQTIVEAAGPVGMRWQGPARVNGRPWAAKDDNTLWLPAGRHIVEPGGEDPPLTLRHLSADLKNAQSNGRLLEFHYESPTGAIAIFSEAPIRLWIDGDKTAAPVWQAAEGYYLRLPAGEHLVGVEAAFGELPSQ